MERRKRKRSKIEAHPLADTAKLRTRGPVNERRKLKREPGTRERVTIHLPNELLERLRNAVYWTPGTTLTAVVMQALTAYLSELEISRGEPFPQRTGAIRLGRPPK